MSVPLSRFRSNLPKTLAPGFVQKQARAARNFCFTQQMADAEPQHGRGQLHSDASKHRPAPQKKAVAAQHGVPRSGRLHGHSRGRTYLAPIKGSTPILQATVIRHQPRHRETTNRTRRQHWVSPEVKLLTQPNPPSSPGARAARLPRTCPRASKDQILSPRWKTSSDGLSCKTGPHPDLASCRPRMELQNCCPRSKHNLQAILHGHRGRPLSYQIR